jgi:hypothetical protein
MFGAGAVRARDGLNYGSGSTKLRQLLKAQLQIMYTNLSIVMQLKIKTIIKRK